MKVLVVEDDPMLGDGLCAGLREAGFVVDWVRDGKSADAALSAGEFAAVVLDLGLPGLDGREVLTRRRADVSTCMRVYMSMCLHICVVLCVTFYVHTCICVYVYMCMHVYTPKVYVSTYMHVHMTVCTRANVYTCL